MSEVTDIAITTPLEKAVHGITTTASMDQVLTVLDFLKSVKAEVKRLDDLADRFAIEWCKANGSLCYIKPDGNKAGYYVKDNNKKTKCRDRAKTFQTILEATGGDVAIIDGLLASEPFKHSAAKKVLTPEQYEACFETTITDSLEEGTPLQLAKFDQSFTR